jgi:hypothetical protein
VGDELFRPLSPPEIRAWISSQTSPHPDEQNMIQVYRLRGALDFGTLCRNAAALLENHPALRTAYTLGPDGELIATVRVPSAVPPVSIKDARAGGEELAAAFAGAAAGEEFDLANPPLLRVLAIRVTDGSHWVLVAVHHIAADGDSFRTIWADLLDGPGTPAPGYSRHVEDLLRYRASGAYAAHLDFWRSRARELDAALRAMASSCEGFGEDDVTSFDVPATSWRAVIDLARTEAVTPFTVVLAMLVRALCQLTGLDRVAIGISVSTRKPDAQQARVVGNYQNILPVVFRPVGLGETGDALFDALEHAAVPLEEILEMAQCGARVFHRQPVSVTATSFAASDPVNAAAGTAEPVPFVQGSKTALSLYLEIHRSHATVHVAGGRGFRLLPTRPVAEEIQCELAALAR